MLDDYFVFCEVSNWIVIEDMFVDYCDMLVFVCKKCLLYVYW